MGTLWADIKYAFRSLYKAPMFTTVAVLSLALGIGANTAIFSLLDQVLLRLLPVKNPKELVLFTMRGQHYGSNWGANAISYPMYRDFQDHNEVFSEMFARYPFTPSLTVDGGTDPVQAEMVSGTYFPSMGIGAAIGRTFTPDDDKTPDGHPIVVLSYSFWDTHFAKDPKVLGKKVLVNNTAMTIIGVAQPGFDGVDVGNAAQIFVPLMMQSEMMPGNKGFLKNRRTRFVNAFGRLKPGITQMQAQASLQPFMHSMLEMEVKEPAFRNASDIVREQFLKCYMDLLPGSQGRSFMRQRLEAPLWVLMAITGTVLLIACANLANLLLARAAGREKEVAVRLAVGASRWRIIKQLLTESLMLAALGGLAGTAIAFAADKALLAAFVPSDARGFKISTTPDFRILLFTFGLTVGTGLLFGLFPALRTTKPNIAPTLKDQAGAVVGGGNVKLRKILVASQVMLSLLLLVGAGLFVKSLSNLKNLGPGFPVERLIAFNINPPLIGYDKPRTVQFYQSLTENLRVIPGVQSVGLAAMRILRNNESDSWMTIEGYTPKPGDRPDAYMNWIGPGYFAALGVPIVAGRDFTGQDTQEVLHREPDNWVPAKIMVNESFVKKYFKDRNPLGRHLGYGIDPGTKTDMEIIGVVKDIKYTNLRDEIPDQAFLPYMAVHGPMGQTVYVRTSADPDSLFQSVRAKVRELDANLPIASMRTVQEDLSDTLVTERMTANLSVVFGSLATLLAMIGLYGVMAYSVARRTREIGIRMALGALEGRVIWMVMKEVLLLVVLGVAAALPAAFALTRLVRAQLYGVTPNDPWTMLLATIGLVLVASAAGFVPAFRASRVDPIRALRYE
ncbi:MAG: ABC transporter permease [Acidobacteriia bacterium]|nr:ABC transporter permease [Terriglobia bacterium]